MANFEFDQSQQDDVIVFPCSATQKQFWLVNQLMPENPAYNIPLGFIADGSLDVNVLEQAVRFLVERHEVLRLTFHWVDEELEQHLLEEYTFNLARESLSENQNVDAFIQAQCQLHFNLADQPAFTASYADLADGRKLVLFNFHHIIVDHRAVLIFEEELKRAYLDISQGNEPQLDELEVQFGDFVLWRDENFPEDELEPVYAFWKKFLDGQSGKLHLPLDRDRPESPVGSGKELGFEFEPSLGRKVIGFAKSSALSPYIVGLTALKVLLHRYADQADIVVGSPFTERGLLDELEGVMGCFLNMLPLPSVIDGKASYSSLLKQQSDDFLQVLDNQTVSLDEIINRIHINRETGMNPLFQVGYTFQEAPADLTFNNINIEGLTLHSGGAMYDLHLWLWEDAGTIKGSLWYSDEIFDDATVSKVISDYQFLFEALIDQPNTPIAALTNKISFQNNEEQVDEDSGTLNASQQLFWFSEQFAHAGASQNICSAWQADSVYPAEQLNQKIASVIQSHPQLIRTLQVEDEGLPRFVSSEQKRLVVEEFQAANLDEAVTKLHDLTAAVFDLTSSVLIRFIQIKHDGGAIMAAVCHNVLLDDVSLNRVVSEWLGCEIPQVNTDERPLAHPYHSERFWDSYLKDEWPVLELIADYERPAQFDHVGSSIDWVIPESIQVKLQAFLKQQKVSAEYFWLALIESILYRHTQQNVIGFGISFPTIEQKQLGCHSEILPYRAEITGSNSFVATVQNTTNAVSRLALHRGMSYQEILSLMQADKDPTRTPLSQCFVSVTKVPQSLKSSEGNAFEKVSLEGVGARTDVSFLVEYDETYTKLEIEYASAIYSQVTLKQIAVHLENFLDNALSNPATSLDCINILDEGESDQLRSATLGPSRDLNHPDLVSLFAESVEAHADRVAVTDQSSQLTYSQLWHRAGSIAANLVEKGFTGQTVAIFMDRTVNMVAAMLGVLRAGATYIPLDPDNPLDRLRIVMEDSKAQTCLTDTQRLSGLDGLGLPIELLNVDEFSESAEAFSADLTIDPMSIAYMIFTSGSTGRPKGVMVQHQAVVNFLQSMSNEPGLEVNDKLLATITISFDMSVLEIMLPLFVGAEVVLATRQQAMDGAQLQELMTRHEITCLQATPTSWRILIATGWEGDTSLKAIVGGEALTQDLRNQLVERVSELWNMYGPTETTVYSTGQKVTEGIAANCIGTAIENTTAYILNPALKQQPVNVPGELCLGGLGVTLGYYERNDLTEEKFVTLPTGERIYRTGDRVHQSTDGRFYYHGRIDDQVKIRGYRIELGEIEARVRALDGVENAAVIVLGNNPAEYKLAAYLQPEPSHNLVTVGMRDTLGETLPSYMIPSHFVEVESIPLTSSGKADKRALAAIPIKEKAQQNFDLDEAGTSLIKGQEEIAEAVVVCDQRTQERICHYQTMDDAYITLGTLRKLARAELGADNAPRQFIEVDDWPRNDNGDVNWLALHETGDVAGAPQTDMEKAIAAIWVSVLGTESVRRTDNFFDIGGHSLLAVQVMMKIRTELGIQISQDRLLLNTLEVLSSECEKISGESTQPEAQSSEPVSDGEAEVSGSDTSESATQESDEKTNSSKGLFKKLFRRGS